MKGGDITELLLLTQEDSFSLSNGGEEEKLDPYIFTISDRYIPVKNTLAVSAVVPCASELMPLCCLVPITAVFTLGLL
jgi:hypothetical protein